MVISFSYIELTLNNDIHEPLDPRYIDNDSIAKKSLLDNCYIITFFITCMQ